MDQFALTLFYMIHVYKLTTKRLCELREIQMNRRITGCVTRSLRRRVFSCDQGSNSLSRRASARTTPKTRMTMLWQTSERSAARRPVESRSERSRSNSEWRLSRWNRTRHGCAEWCNWIPTLDSSPIENRRLLVVERQTWSLHVYLLHLWIIRPSSVDIASRDKHKLTRRRQ